MEHQSHGNEIVDGGIIHRCSCGWVSRPCFSNAIASVEGMEHRDAMAKANIHIIFTRAHVPVDLGNAWLQHLRDFDVAHPGCHFEVMIDGDNIPLEVAVEALRVTPGLTFQKIFERKE